MVLDETGVLDPHQEVKGTIQWEQVSQGITLSAPDQIERVPPDKHSLERVNSVNPPQAGPTLPVGPNKGGTGKSIPHTFTEVLDSVREDPSAASFPSIF